MAHRIPMDRTWLRLVLVACASVAGLGQLQKHSIAQAPAFYQDELPADFEKKRASEAKGVAEIFRGSAEYNNETVKQYLKSSVLPFLTQYPRPADLNRGREELRRLVEENGIKSEQSKKELSDLIVELLKDFVGGQAPNKQKYHPSTRLAAFCILCQVDQKPAMVVAQKTEPAIPHPLAFREIGRIVMDPSAEGPFADAFLIEALVGLERHSRLSASTWNAQTKAALGKKLVQYLVSPAPAPRDPAVHLYVQRRILDCLIRFESEDHKIARKFMIDAARDKNADSYLRMQCIRNLFFPATYNGLSAEELESLTTSIVHFVMHECKKWEESINPSQMVMGGMGAMGAMGSGSGSGKGMGAPGADIGSEGSGSGMMSGAGLEGSSGDGSGMGSMGGQGTGRVNPLDQPVELRLARRKLNMLLEYSRTGLDGAVKGKFQNGAAPGSPESKRGLVGGLGESPNIAEIKRLVEMISVLQDTINGLGVVPLPPGSTKKQDLNDKIPISTLPSLTSALNRPMASSDGRIVLKSFKAFLEAANDYPGVKQLDEPEEAKTDLAVADPKAVQ